MLLAACGRVGFDVHGGDAGGTMDDGVLDASSRLISWWQLDEGSGTAAHDSVGPFDGRLFPGTGGNPIWVPGHPGTAVSFAGDGDAIDVSPAFANLPAMSDSAWVNPGTLSVLPATRCILDKGQTNGGWTFYLSALATGDVGFDVITTGTRTRRISTGNVVPLDTWTHVAVTWDGGTIGSQIHLYVGGNETTYAMTIDADSSRADDSAIATMINCNAGTGFTGALDNIRVYDRVLSPAEVASLAAM